MVKMEKPIPKLTSEPLLHYSEMIDYITDKYGYTPTQKSRYWRYLLNNQWNTISYGTRQVIRIEEILGLGEDLPQVIIDYTQRIKDEFSEHMYKGTLDVWVTW